MIAPTVHLNGTSGEELRRQVSEAGTAVRDALRALANAAPNARDYYPAGPDAFRAASAEHASRVARVKAVAEELYDIEIAIVDAMAERSR